MGDKGLVADLRAACGAEHVVTDPRALRVFESDGLLQYRAVPAVAVAPATTDEVRRVVLACLAAEVPFVARGAGTGLSGGALPLVDGVLVNLSRMRRVVEIDLPNQRVTVQPGVTNRQISAVVAPTHFYAPDPSSQAVCTIGGNVAENSGGVHCFKYGFTTNYVVGLEVVLSDGEVVRLGGKELDRPGYDLVGVFVGSEGTLGIATEVTVRVLPRPEAARTLVAAYTSPELAGAAVSEIVAAGLVPGAMEIMDHLAIVATEAATGAGNPLDAGAILLVEVDGPTSECEAPFQEILAICRRGGATGIRVAADDAERELLWTARRSAFGAAGRLASGFYVQDGVIPRTRLPEVLARINELAREHGVRVANVFHAGDGNLHPLVLFDASDEAEARRAAEVADLIAVACVEEGGSLTGEHGIGIDKRASLPKMFAETDLAAFQLLRCAFDPLQRANPGKVMPTPRLCGEVPGPYRQHPLERAGLAVRL